MEKVYYLLIEDEKRERDQFLATCKMKTKKYKGYGTGLKGKNVLYIFYSLVYSIVVLIFVAATLS